MARGGKAARAVSDLRQGSQDGFFESARRKAASEPWRAIASRKPLSVALRLLPWRAIHARPRESAARRKSPRLAAAFLFRTRLLSS